MKKKILVVAGLLAMSGALTAQSVYPGQHAGKLKRETVAPMKVKSFDLKDVRLLPSRFRENMMRDSMWMASIEVNSEGGNLAASKIRNLECPSYEICLIDYGCGKFNRKIHIMEQYP